MIANPATATEKISASSSSRCSIQLLRETVKCTRSEWCLPNVSGHPSLPPPLVTYRRDWGGHRVYFHGDTGRLASLPAQWTSLFPVDPFVAVSAGRSHFRIQDLLELSQLIARIRQGGAS